MKQILFLALISLFIASCNSKGTWVEFSAKGIPDAHQNYNDLLFVNDSSAYLGGDSLSDVKVVNHEYIAAIHTILYKTTNSGRSWSKIPLEYNNSVNKILYFQDTLILLLQSPSSDSICIVRSQNNGRSWKAILSLHRDNKYVRDIHFKTPNDGYISIDSASAHSIWKYKNDQWSTISDLPNNYYHNAIFDTHIVSLTSTSALISNLKSKATKQVLFGKEYFIASSTKYKNDLFIAVSHNKRGGILRLTERGVETIDLGNYFNYQPQEIYVFNNTILATAYRNEDAAFLGVIHSLLISNDSGKTWTLENLPDPMYDKPATLNKDSFFISYGGIGRFQILKLKD